MTFLVSPGVSVREIDNTTSVPPVSTATGAYVGNFRWGPVDEITTVESEASLVSTFGAPSAASSVDFHVASYFLKYSRDLRVVRANNGGTNANVVGATDLTVNNSEDYEGKTFTLGTHGHFMSRYPGSLGNSLKVAVFGFKTDANTTLTNFNSWDFASGFTGPVGTSAYAARFGSTNDEIHIAIIDEDGLFSGVKGTVLERYPYLSQASDAKSEDGSSTYYADVINAQSKYVRFAATDTTNFANAGSSATDALDFSVAPASGKIETSLSGGSDSAAFTTGTYTTAWDFFGDKSTSDVSFMIAPNLTAANGTVVANHIISIADLRKDCVAFVSPPAGYSVDDIVTFADSLTFSSYAFIDSGRLKVYDKFNDQFINIPANSSVAGLTADTDRVAGAWFSPAGLRRGQLRGVTKLYLNPTQIQRDTLYKRGVNPIVAFPGEGTILFGDKTHLGRPSAFDRINVRRLFIVLEKAIEIASRSTLFEFNDVYTRAQFVNLVDPFLRTVQGRRGITDFKVICDETNNTGDVIDRNEFVGDIYIKPSRSVNFISLNFVATRTGVSFNEITGG